MKKIKYLMFLLVLFMATAAFSQQKKVTLSLKNVTVKTALEALKAQSGLSYWINANDVDMEKVISVNLKSKTVEDALKSILQGQDVNYHLSGDHIVISKVTREVDSKQENATPQQGGELRKITGEVTDEKGQSLPGVTVAIQGVNKGTITDVNGNYTLENISPNQMLEFSFVGMQKQYVTVGNKNVINVALSDGAVALNEVVAIGYGVIKKSDLTGAVTNIKGSDIKSSGTSNLASALQGKMSGVSIESASGQPGSGTRVLIRGVGTLGNASPLYIVDGVEVANIDNLSQSDIQSIDVLKDASAAAIYGSRAANGVVLVTTNSGKDGQTIVQMSANYGVQDIAHEVSVLNAEQWATVSNAAHDAAGLARLNIAQNPQTLGVGTNWQDAIYRSAPVQRYGLTVSGGSQSGNYSITGGYISQDGIVNLTEYKRYNFRVKSETTKGILKFGETVLFTNENSTNMNIGNWGGRGNAVGAALVMIPVFQIYDPTALGGYSGASGPVASVANPVAQLNLENAGRIASSILINGYGELTIMPDLKYKLNLGYTNNNGTNSDYLKRNVVGAFFAHSTNDLSLSKDQNLLLSIENTLNYNKTFGKNSLQVLAGYTYQKINYTYLSAARTNLPDGIINIDAGAGISTTGGNSAESTLLSALGRVIYSYDNKYLMTASFRRDGSSRFSSSNRYGNFPSIALGWNIAHEKFFEPLTKVVSILKLRTSYGVLGNQEIGDYQYSAAVASNINYVTGTTQQKWFGSIQTTLVSPNIKWENTQTTDVGIDAGFLNNKLTITADYFNKITSDVLLNVPIPGSAGSISNPVVNAGKLSNNGVELGFNFSDHIGKLDFNLFGTLSSVKNKVLELGTGSQQIFGGQPTIQGGSTTITQAGGPITGFYLVKELGIFNSQEEINAYQKAGKLIQPNASPGDVKFLDANSDGQINNNDAVYLGSPFPNYEYGFGFNVSMYNIDINVFLQGTQGNKIYNGLRQDLEGMSQDNNYSIATLNAWTPQNHSNIPRAVINDPNFNDRISSRFLEDGSYLRMKTVQIGYTFNDFFKKVLKITSLRAYLSGDNLFTITKYSGANPDLGRSGSIFDRGVDWGLVAYPLAKTISVGIQLTL
jgi:TonB-linked SusC/RagA family outer membrane protein